MTRPGPPTRAGLEPRPEDLHLWTEADIGYQYQPTPYDLGITDDPEPELITEISVPTLGDNGIQRLHSHMLEVEPLPEVDIAAEAELDAGI